MIAQELEVSLHMAFVEARQKQHEFITVEHLLLAMLDNPSAAEVLKSCGVELDELRGVLTDFISEHTPRLSPHSDADTQPTQGFQRVIQRAILHVHDRALDHALESEGRLGVDLVGAADGGRVLLDEADQALPQIVQVRRARAQHFGRRRIVKQRHQQVLDGDEFMALLPGLDEGHVQADL